MLKFYDKEHDITLTFDIVGYQFPDIMQGGDADWCNVSMHLQQADKQFKVTEATITAKDLPRLLKWFTDLSERKLPATVGVGFLEPCFSFEFLACTENSVKIRTFLSLEMRPNFYIKQSFFSAEEDDEEYYINFDLTDIDFTDNIESLKNTIEKFPIRCSHY